MEKLVSGKIKRSKDRHAPEVSLQTGFPSAATHYHEASIDLHNELVYNQDATFFIRVEGNSWSKFNIRHNDVLIIDRALKLKQNRLALVVQEGEFDVIRFSENQAKSEFLLWGVVSYIIKDVL
ncbi:S24 family peptidase [Christiangramia sediminis]|uniref:Peptidase S24 n=1 Tax=Christiangramia sediminis TaxID=2881336 RepID=A0A9X1LHZ5_9FLAO|nr:S24 family peptidase [Christiangramia sediminis]MCB7480675.1 peptidase S24 [Christiangramia sediminis]